NGPRVPCSLWILEWIIIELSFKSRSNPPTPVLLLCRICLRCTTPGCTSTVLSRDPAGAILHLVQSTVIVSPVFHDISYGASTAAIILDSRSPPPALHEVGEFVHFPFPPRAILEYRYTFSCPPFPHTGSGADRHSLYPN
ncbi:unnamed protein product, partial [Tuber aestivum]